MAKRRGDRAFHLTVTVFALTLAAISGITLLYQRDRQVIPNSWLPKHVKLHAVPSGNATHSTGDNTPLDATNATHPAASSAGRKANATGQTGGTEDGSQQVAADLVGKPVFHQADNASLVKVSAFGADTPQTEVQHVDTLLSKYQIVNQVSTALQMNLQDQVHIYLVHSSQDYERALSSLFGISASEAKNFSADTGGFTQNESILVPLYQNQDDPDLVNTLAHELTHAFLNDNVQASIPSWINEGLAVSDGMMLQRQAENDVAYDGDAKTLAESVMEAAAAGQLVPLTSDENEVLTGDASYDLELQDWLAVSDLRKLHGADVFSDYLYRLNRGESNAEAFERTFGETSQAFNASFTSLLKTAAAAADQGVSLTFQVSSSYHGYLRLLQHGSHNWQGFLAQAGTVQVKLSKDGQLTGSTGAVTQTYDPTKPDDHTVYINLDPNQTLTYQGQPVQDCGLALDYHDGLYGFVNGWVTWENGKSTYFYNPTLFGVTLTAVSEQNAADPVLSLLQLS
ncbi:hypothetical protein JI721_08365 [Alicyclobacillus cycloheptanicus]|uniref:Peptidase MA superfamily protein n=1 Tax=Alicyclobacillus cycloheptanicus TaxID=1457 RepID=A0ABT9XLB9_9BACL|nr:hypothetical protein [Alicyclobacillus cycloheptanicus]MDQ0191107.1 hypothetical protein [Alicyclobacillus cycloheptanicus]WDM02753.1 hypothetical protein JI721_08365 [Alicyclobacillus cycloheptanicus]